MTGCSHPVPRCVLGGVWVVTKEKKHIKYQISILHPKLASFNRSPFGLHAPSGHWSGSSAEVNLDISLCFWLSGLVAPSGRFGFQGFHFQC